MENGKWKMENAETARHGIDPAVAGMPSIRRPASRYPGRWYGKRCRGREGGGKVRECQKGTLAEVGSMPRRMIRR